MSVQKLIAEADKLFDKGKVPDGIAKLKSALSTEPLNQLVATKLATVLVQNKEPLEAAKIYGGLAKRLSDAGKSSVAIAIYKQALELAPDDITLRFRYASECESVGKLGDAFLQAQIVLTYYLRRKKYFDASNVLPVMARAQPKDDKVKLAWIEVMQLCQAEQKLLNLLVALCGPPGMASPDFPVGGDPSTLTPVLYEGLRKLVPFYPRDPKIAYAVAWCAYRRGARAETFHYLHECLRREPDYCLAILLFARILAEDKKLNEALFLYRYYKERMGTDKNSDMLTLNRLLESFVEKNGWIKFTEDAGDLLDAAGFKASITGKKVETPTPQQVEVEEAAARRVAEPEGKALGLPPAEIELGGDSSPGDSMEIVTATGQSIQEVSKQKKAAGTSPGDPLRMQAELIKATVEDAVAGMGNTNPQMAKEKQSGVKPVAADDEENSDDLEGFKGESVDFTSLIKRSDIDAAVAPPAESAAPGADDATRVAAPDPEDSGKTTVAPLADDKTTVQPMGATPAPDEDEPAEDEPEAEAPAKKKLFNPLDHAMIPDSQATSDSLRLEGNEERTQMFSPMDVLAAANVMKNRELGNVNTKQIDVNRLAEEERAIKDRAAEELEGDKSRWRDLKADGAGTQLFSPVEALKAATDSRRPHEVAMTVPPPIVPPPAPAVTPPTPPPLPVVAATTPAESPPPTAAPAAEPSLESLRDSGDATVVMNRADLAAQLPAEEKAAPVPAPAVAEPAAPSVAAEAAPPPAAQAPTTTPEHQTISLAEHTKTPVVAIDPSTPEAEGGIPSETEAGPAPASEGPAFTPIPTAAAPAKPGIDDEQADLGDDLLEGPTRIFTQTSAGDKTEHLLKEIKHDLKNAAGERQNIELLMKKADRFTAKRNYYLARKALRHAQALGADEEKVKTRLREIRKLEFPEGLYNTMSSDVPSTKVDTSEVLERLELEFDLTEASADSEELSAVVEKRIEAILQENDPRTILDFGVGLHEMAMFRQAEALFIRVVEEFPDFAFDAYYLAAVSKLSRSDYAGAASILKRLSTDAAKTDLEKIQIYYALGETFEKMRQRDRSRKFFEKVAELDANYRNIRHKLDG